jgi:hypothetical protein
VTCACDETDQKALSTVLLQSWVRAIFVDIAASPPLRWHCQVGGVGCRSVREGWIILRSWMPCRRRCTRVTGSRWRSSVTGASSRPTGSFQRKIIDPRRLRWSEASTMIVEGGHEKIVNRAMTCVNVDIR